MANSKGSSNVRNLIYTGKHPLLPPKIPFPSVSPSYLDYIPNSLIGSKVVQRPREGNFHHQRTSSETFPIEEQPSWLDDLLNEPETPVCRPGHRRSSSDSFTYIDNASNFDYASQDEYGYRNMDRVSPWGSLDPRQVSLYGDISSIKQKNRTWDLPLSTPQEADGVSSINEQQDSAEIGQYDSKTLSERKDGVQAKSLASEADTKRAKQQFAQRSRVRKLQYIAELERNVQALQAEGSEVSAEVEFLNQQNLILNMENKALKQRLDNLAQEQFIKCFEHEVLEREIGRLRALYQQQQQPQPPQPSSSHRRTKSRDLESHFSNLSLKHKDTNTTRDPVTGPLRT